VLYTYRAFMTGPQLFMALVNRFNAEPPVDPTPEEIDYYNECISIVRLKYGPGRWARALAEHPRH